MQKKKKLSHYVQNVTLLYMFHVGQNITNSEFMQNVSSKYSKLCMLPLFFFLINGSIFLYFYQFVQA